MVQSIAALSSCAGPHALTSPVPSPPLAKRRRAAGLATHAVRGCSTKLGPCIDAPEAPRTLLSPRPASVPFPCTPHRTPGRVSAWAKWYVAARALRGRRCSRRPLRASRCCNGSTRSWTQTRWRRSRGTPSRRAGYRRRRRPVHRRHHPYHRIRRCRRRRHSCRHHRIHHSFHMHRRPHSHRRLSVRRRRGELTRLSRRPPSAREPVHHPRTSPPHPNGLSIACEALAEPKHNPLRRP